MAPGGITFVGMDAHKKAINVAMLLPGKSEAVEWQVAHEPAAIRRLAKKLEREAPGEVRCCYEAGPCGYVLQRELEAAGGVICEVVAPSLTPVKPGERIKTDRRDARKLARLLRSDDLTTVHPPTAADEAVRDLCRCREDARKDLLRARHRLGTFLLRRACSYTQTRRTWGRPYREWVKSLKFEHAADRVTLEDYLTAMDQLEERLQFDHMDPVARGGQATVERMRLRCRAHNQYGAEQTFGTEFMNHKRRAAQRTAAETRARVAAEQARAQAAAAKQAQEGDVIPWLRKLGFRADEARRAAAFCEDIPDAPLEERVRVALSFLAPARRARNNLGSAA